MNKLIHKYNDLSEPMKATIWFTVCSFFIKAISTFTTPIFTRLLTVTEYGNYNVIITWNSILTILITFQISLSYCSQGIVKYSEDKKRFSSSIQGLISTLVIVAFIIYLLFKTFWNELFSMNTIEMLCVLSLILTTSVFNCWSAEKRSEYSYKPVVFVTIIICLAKPITGIIFVSCCNDKVTARIFGLALVELIVYSGIYISQWVKGKAFFIKKYWRDALFFSIPLVPHYLSQILLASSDKIMIQNLIGSDEAGIYSLAYSIGFTMQAFSTAIIQATSPWIYNKIKNDRIDNIDRVIYISLCVLAIVNIVLCAFSPEIIKFFAPADYLNAIWVIPSVAASVYIQLLYSFTVLVPMYFGKTVKIMLGSIASAIINLCLNYLFLPLFGFYAAGYTTLISYTVLALIVYYCMKDACNKHMRGKYLYDIKIIIKMSIILLCVLTLFTLSYFSNYVRVILIIILAMILFVFRKKIIESIKMLSITSHSIN